VTGTALSLFDGRACGG